jgi:hypothetical protein
VDGKNQISGKLVLEIMFVQVVRVSPFTPFRQISEGCMGFIFQREEERTGS